jgi:hypothetical protein
LLAPGSVICWLEVMCGICSTRRRNLSSLLRSTSSALAPLLSFAYGVVERRDEPVQAFLQYAVRGAAFYGFDRHFLTERTGRVSGCSIRSGMLQGFPIALALITSWVDESLLGRSAAEDSPSLQRGTGRSEAALFTRPEPDRGGVLADQGGLAQSRGSHQESPGRGDVHSERYPRLVLGTFEAASSIAAIERWDNIYDGRCRSSITTTAASAKR